ncbi:MAG: hypothetical protein UR25_C0001G0169 [Candidatus Nomurabacteria bacterium GW2011_GWE1_32_28]|uniref:2'-deoxynucleoside 5'-phosphate N-hydrolase 1 n=1 Tax=Candidatus Nomurabacteria bacterium GW2011_GWF1_31_48 TaxID=1618767 RepID=A0A0F9YG64_9BACT|nr:MAG: hypothetical protein UR10_C0002G0110 [Candidatus Nomurabacteria bacterium GW2011_GWF2_30_133]KKP29001.1 MAG: hypothetical protein UR18_C0001G0122 [Candidatus Nomurabacteria bacterium GW2011_GWE2_31_40]KKP30589.1 MAG: hypothetical protein UR19_C0002G0110 [Candidatus Nomurabacteria bacterium GW2011_GWF1_31_48]KKP35256.1 MAG: hypothetical protein UR25_C0001G0169 [Candidatus Nomurabacteria bacterium GW2011_GWE1_32_28]HAS80563.1 hypothetical protein [Candidatus Nomurabacteria bacterium]
MNIYISHSRYFDFKNELYKPIRESNINNLYSFFLPHENQNDSDNIERILKADLIIAEVSYPSTGQGIEIGIASVSNIPILCIYKEGSKISRSLKHTTNQLISYSNSQDLIYKITNFLVK